MLELLEKTENFSINEICTVIAVMKGQLEIIRATACTGMKDGKPLL